MTDRDDSQQAPTGVSGDGFDPLPRGVAEFTDLANAHRLARDCHGRLRYAHGLGWLVFDGKRFGHDESAAARCAQRAARKLLQLSRELGRRAQRDPDPAAARRAKQYAKWAKGSQQSSRLQATLTVAKTLRDIACPPDMFDAEPMVLNVANGTLDLRTGLLRPHSVDDLITRLAPVAYDAAATCPTWLAFLERILAGDARLVRFLQVAAGYSLTGSCSEQCFFVCHGRGANGKSTMLETLRGVLGDYSRNTPTDTLLRSGDRRGPENDLARLRGARFVSAVESGEGRRLDEERVKRLTGGDTVTARFLYREHFEFVNSAKIWMAVNDRPEITGVDDGIWRRVRLIPFDVTIPASEQDRQLPAKLREEGPGILRWAVEGCRLWQDEGLQSPAPVEAATGGWRNDANPVALFVAEQCSRGEALTAMAGALYEAYCAWSAEGAAKPLSAKGFGMRLSGLGFAPVRRRDGRCWAGLALASRTKDNGDA